MNEGIHKIRDLRKQIRQAFGDYVRSEGCSCCRQDAAHEAAAAKLGKLLRVMRYADGSGYDFYKYSTTKNRSAKP